MKDIVAPMYDQGYSALIEDLVQRGMLDNTLVCNLAEFGRTPRVNPAGGRDHWPQCWTVYFAGGGVQGRPRRRPQRRDRRLPGRASRRAGGSRRPRSTTASASTWKRTCRARRAAVPAGRLRQATRSRNCFEDLANPQTRDAQEGRVSMPLRLLACLERQLICQSMLAILAMLL